MTLERLFLLPLLERLCGGQPSGRPSDRKFSEIDEVLAAREALDGELRVYVRERATGSGVEVTELGVKDVILPGEIRALATMP